MKMKAACLALLLLACCSCSSRPFSQKPKADAELPSVSRASTPDASSLRGAEGSGVGGGQAPFKKRELVLSIKGDRELNRYRNNAHALFVCVYQLKEPNAFLQLAEEKEGIPRLLECGRFDGSVAHAKRTVVQPGQNLEERRDRAEGARFIGIAAGYYGTGKQKLSDLQPLSVQEGGLPGNSIDIVLGAYEIEKVTVK